MNRIRNAFGVCVALWGALIGTIYGHRFGTIGLVSGIAFGLLVGFVAGAFFFVITHEIPLPFVMSVFKRNRRLGQLVLVVWMAVASACWFGSLIALSKTFAWVRSTSSSPLAAEARPADGG